MNVHVGCRTHSRSWFCVSECIGNNFTTLYNIYKCIYIYILYIYIYIYMSVCIYIIYYICRCTYFNLFFLVMFLFYCSSYIICIYYFSINYFSNDYFKYTIVEINQPMTIFIVFIIMHYYKLYTFHFDLSLNNLRYR